MFYYHKWLLTPRNSPQWGNNRQLLQLFLPSALTSQRLLTLYGTLVLYTNCCSSPYPAPFTIGLFITYLVEAIAQNFSLPFQAYLLLKPAYSRVHLSDLYRIYSIHPDLVPCCPGNRFNKYADDNYILSTSVKLQYYHHWIGKHFSMGYCQ